MRSPGMALSLLCALTCVVALSLLVTPAQSTGATITALSNSPVTSPPFTDLPITNPVTATTTALFLPVVAGPPPARVVIAAAHVDSSVSYEPDEAVLLWNIGNSPQPLAGWQLAAGNRTATFPLTSTMTLAANARIWCAAEAAAFAMTFGLTPACVWEVNDGVAGDEIVTLEGDIGLTNRGGALRLLNAQGETVDVLLYGDEGGEFAGWQGAPVQPYTRGAIPRAGQILTRKQHPATLAPLDTDRAADWISDLADVAWGRRVRFPGWHGWSADAGARPAAGVAGAAVTVAIGPEGLYGTLANTLGGAQTTIDLSIYTLEHPELTAILAAAAARGVTVRVLLEGSPPGGISNLQKWCVAQLAAAGADVRYLAPQADAPNGLRPRFSYTHAKYGVIDGRTALIGTDNFNRDSMPLTREAGGRRGVYLITDAMPVISELARIFAGDWTLEPFVDLRAFTPDDARYGGPPADYAPAEPSLYAPVDASFHMPLTVWGEARFGLVSAPENALHPDAGLMALLAQAGAGDEVLVEQLYEHKFWGDGDSNPIADPNPRLQAMLDAARRGATVRLLLDSYFDDAEHLRSNRATVDYVRMVAAAEGLDLDARVGNPTGGGIHAKIVLVRLGEAHWSAIGSLNGSEVSHKLNREVVVLVDMDEVYGRLAELFYHDWAASE